MEKYLEELFNNSIKENDIPNELYTKYDVKKGLRNQDGTGVLIGLTKVAEVIGYTRDENHNKVNCEGRLLYRGYDINDLVNDVETDNAGFEKICFLILFGHMPNSQELFNFRKTLIKEYELPEGFMVTNILRQPSINIMNKIQRALLMLYSEDPTADDINVKNTLEQGLSIIAKLPSIMVYAYQAKNHIIDNGSLIIHRINPEYTIAENILSLLRVDQKFTDQEVKTLDMLLVLHADHGSGNNSTFTNLVVSSTNTDIYSAFSASVGSLKGPRHGGANISARHMMKAVIDEIGLDASDEDIKKIIVRILEGKFFDNSGLIYGLGHAVYTKSDPRCEIIKTNARYLSEEKGREKEFDFYQRFEKLAKEWFMHNKNRDICANIDFYSGLVYEMLGIPEDLFSPLFVVSRSVGWLAHNIENKLYCDKIIRPAGLYVGDFK